MSNFIFDHDEEGRPIAGSRKQVKDLPPVKRESMKQAARNGHPFNWQEKVRTARHNHQGYVSIENLYQTFKGRLLRELAAEVDQPPDIGAQLPLTEVSQTSENEALVEAVNTKFPVG